MNKNKEKRVAARSRVAAGKRAGWPLPPPCKKDFEGFAGFVTKIEIQSNNNQIIRTMKNIRIIAVIALMMMGGMTMKAQDYHPIVEEGKQWNVLFSYPWNPPEPPHRYTDIYKIEGDTLLDGVSYKVMYTTRNEDLTDWNCWGFLRETEDRQVFSRRPSTSDEQLLYDFSMQVGDTIFMYEDYMVVVEIGEVLVGDEPRQQIVLEYPFGETETWIEGIGSLYGIIDSGSHFLVGGSTDLLCYYEDGDLIWQNSYPSINSCYFVYSGGGQSGLVVTPTVLTFDEPAMPQTFTISNQLDVDVTITNIYVQPDDNIVLVSHTDLPQTIQPGESMDVEVELNGIGNKGYNTYHIYMLTSEGAKVVTVRVNDNLNPYYPIVQESNNRQKWNVVYIASNENYPNDYFTEIQSIRDNITLDGVDYRLVWKEDVYNSKRIAGAVREEDKRVYYRMYWQQSYQNEVLLYDFNLTVGDTVSVGWSDYRLIVLEESQVQVNGTMRRQLGLAMYFDDGTTGEVEEYWIEGVGSTYGFLNSGYEGWVGAFVHLLCYHENGNLIWDNEEFDDCVMNSDGAPATFAPQGAEWYFHVLSQGPITEPPFHYIQYMVTGEEEKQGHTCSVINGYEYVYEEDGVVYWYNSTDEEFTVLYDFNAEVGDSWYCAVADYYPCLITVDSVGSVTWDGHTYRTQYVTGVIEDYWTVMDGRIIEGIGYEKGLFPEVVIDGPEYEYMRCYLVDGEMLYHEGDYDCDYVPNTGSSCWDGTVAEAYAGGDGTAENPYQIATSEQLALLAYETNNGTGSDAYYELVANINLQRCEGGTIQWVSIGTATNMFMGHFNGNGYNILNLNQFIGDGDLQPVGGLFGYTDHAVISNVRLVQCSIRGNGQYVGGLVGYAGLSNISNCSITQSSVKTEAGVAGGLVGCADMPFGTGFYPTDIEFSYLNNCLTDVATWIEGSDCAGGIVGKVNKNDGRNPWVIADCRVWDDGYTAGFSVTSDGDAGGIVGWFRNGSISGCLNQFVVTGGNPGTGGIAGTADLVTIKNCINQGEISGGFATGGIVGYGDGNMNVTSLDIIDCVNEGSVTCHDMGQHAFVGGIVGLWGSKIIRCVNKGDVMGIVKSSGFVGGIVGDCVGIVANCYNRGNVTTTVDDSVVNPELLFVGGISATPDPTIYNVYNTGVVTGPELPASVIHDYGNIIGRGLEDSHYLNAYWLDDDDLSACGNVNEPELHGSTAFVQGATSTSWTLNDAQYGTTDLLEALNFGAAVVLDSVPSYPHICTWMEDMEGTNDGFPVFGPFSAGDDMLEAYCEAPFNFFGSPTTDQGIYGAQLWWNKPFASHWVHYDEKPYAGSAEAFEWGIRIPGEEIHAGDMLTHVAFYKVGGQNEATQYDFAFSGGETEPENLEFLAWNSVLVEPGPDEWVMVKLRYPIICEEGRSLWIVMSAPFVAGNKAPYCQTSGNPDARWVSLIGGWYDYLAVEGTGGDWMIRGYFTNDMGYQEAGYNEDLDHYNIYRGSSLEEMEKVAEVGRDAEEYFDTLEQPFGDYYYQLTASYTDGRESVPARRSENPHSPDYVYFHVGNISSLGSEWYYEIQNENGSITYQHLEYAADTTINHKDVKIIIRTNTLYDKGEHSEVTREYIYEDFGKVYWWNESIQDFTLLYNLGAQVGDEWVIEVGEESIIMHVDAVEQYEYEGTTYRMLHVSDANNLFSGEIMSGVGHLTSFFPERLMTRDKGYRVTGLRCYWIYGDLVFTVNRGDCDAIYAELHNGLDEPTAIPFTIYPNPTNGVLTIHHSEFNIPHSSFRITNLMGQTVQTGRLNVETQQIDVSGLPQGMYFITVGEGTRKFVVK